MQISRRDFFAGLLGIFAGAAVATKGIAEVISEGTNPNWDGTVRLSTLHEAYYDCCSGRHKPDTFIVSPHLYAEIFARFRECERNPRDHEQWPTTMSFMGARITASPFMADDKIWIRNEACPNDPRLNKIIELTA